jgi:hypothetical protein
VGRKAKQPAGLLGRLGRKLKEIPFKIKIRLLNLQRLWKFVQDDLGGILMWRFFLNCSGLLKDFRKIKHAMPCHEMHPMQDYFFGRIFICTAN